MPVGHDTRQGEYNLLGPTKAECGAKDVGFKIVRNTFFTQLSFSRCVD